MNGSMMKLSALLLSFAMVLTAFSQYDWKLTRDQDGIKVYQSDVPNSHYNNIRVECTVPGTYDKLIGVLTNLGRYKDWVYQNKLGYILKKVSPTEYYIYTETFVPWPLNNRDVVSFMRIDRDKQDRYLKVTQVSVPNYIPPKPGKVRVPKSNVTYNVTKISSSSIHISYTLELEPGGEVPGWLVNNFADKGPFETFRKLREIMKKS
ncbi:MAG: START domain-containing protein [Candidatus Dadabacteria bacterium]